MSDMNNGRSEQALHEERDAGRGSEMPSSRAENEAARAGYRPPTNYVKAFGTGVIQ